MSKNKDEKKDKIFKLVQKFLKDPPLIIWGSGATIPFGLPSMGDLNEALKNEIDDYDEKNNNIEVELGKEKYKEKMPKIKKVIWDKINSKDVSVLNRIVLNDTIEFNGIKQLLEKFLDVHPTAVNIVTTNYDRVLENIMSYNNISFTDGFNGKTLSVFDESKFNKKMKKTVNLIKVHGSLNWFNVNEEIRYLYCPNTVETSQIIVPGKNKYKDAYDSPYRELIQKSDVLVKNASSFLVVGFGFNDEHLTPKIKAKVNKGTPIVLITKSISENSFKELEKAEKYILFEKQNEEKTKIIFKENSVTEKKEIELEGNYWQLNKFMEII